MILFICIACAVLLLILLAILFVVLFAKFKFRVFINNKDIKIYWKRKIIYDSMEEYEDYDDSEEVEKSVIFEKRYKKMKRIINLIRSVLDDRNDDLIYIFRYAKKTVSVEKLDVSLDYGFDDAALTGITGGVIWTVISGVCGLVGRFIDIKRFTNIAVKPHYTENIIDFKLDLVFNISIYNYLKTKRLIKRFKKTLEGRR